MDMKPLARVGAIAFVAFAITATVLTMRDAPTTPRHDDVVAAPDIIASDPLATELLHCQSIGQAGASDRDCLKAWAENRRRFLMPDARPEAEMSDAPEGSL